MHTCIISCYRLELILLLLAMNIVFECGLQVESIGIAYWNWNEKILFKSWVRQKQFNSALLTLANRIPPDKAERKFQFMMFITQA